jgi:hypothetical protein
MQLVGTPTNSGGSRNRRVRPAASPRLHAAPRPSKLLALMRSLPKGREPRGIARESGRGLSQSPHSQYNMATFLNFRARASAFLWAARHDFLTRLKVAPRSRVRPSDALGSSALTLRINLGLTTRLCPSIFLPLPCRYHQGRSTQRVVALTSPTRYWARVLQIWSLSMDGYPISSSSGSSPRLPDPSAGSPPSADSFFSTSVGLDYPTPCPSTSCRRLSSGWTMCVP